MITLANFGDGFIRFLSISIWPLLIFYLVGFRFRREVSRILSGNWKASAGSFQVEVAQHVAESPEKEIAARISAAPLLVIDNEAVRIAVDNVLATLATHQIDTLEKVRTTMVPVFAKLSVELKHERNYRLIFGSQIRLLKLLNDFGPRRASECRPLYDAVVKNETEFYRDYPFESWLQFVIGSGLIELVEDKLQITIFGRDFLRYLPMSQLTEAKAH